MKNLSTTALLGLVAAGFALWWLSRNGVNLLAINTPDTWPTGDPIWDVCNAIAKAEGYDQTSAAPFKLNNPGDLSPGDEHGFATSGPSEFHGGSYVIHFATAGDGWQALYTKISNIVQGASNVYDVEWTWEQIGAKYAADANWARNVAANLGVDPTSTLSDYISGAV